MMARMLSQAPLPWLPGDAVEIAPGVGVQPDGDGGGVAWVHGLATFAWDAGDEAARRLAAVQLVRLGAATQRQVAAGFGTDPVTVWRWDAALREHGVAGLVPARRGPKGPSKLSPELAARIRKLDGQGMTLAQIAAECGVSTFTVRSALGRVWPRGAGSPGGAGQDDEPAAPQPHEKTEPEPGAEEEAEALPVLPGPVGPRRRAGAGPVRPARRGRRAGLCRRGALPAGRAAAGAAPRWRLPGCWPAPGRCTGGCATGFYGLGVMLVFVVFLALLREPRAEGATRIDIQAVGRVLGLDRAPEVKTIRRKLGELAARGRAAELQLAIAAHHAAARPDQLGFLYIDGHMRAYFGTRDVQQGHVARLKFPAPATAETWVTDSAGDPLLVVIGEPSDSLAGQIRGLLPDLRTIAGEHARPTLCFDRGGWSPGLFAEVIDAGFDLLTWRKKDAGQDLPDLPGDQFTAVTRAGDDGKPRGYDLADTDVQITVRSGKHKGRVLHLRQVTRRKPGRDGTLRQAHILTTRGRSDLPAAAVAWRMSSRWREENYFRYGRAHFALDALDSYKVTPDNPARLVPNPAKKAASAAVASARKALERAEARRDARLAELKDPAPGTTVVITNKTLNRLAAPVELKDPAPGTTVVITNKTLNRLAAPVETARRKLAAAQGAARAIPAKIPLGQHNPKMVRLDTETKLITHAIRMAAFNTEVMLARALHGHYARADDEAAALIREALTVSGDIIPRGGQLLVRLDPLSAPRRTRALAALCDQLSTAGTSYPGTGLTLRYEVKNHTGAA
jgi:transposase